MKDHQQSPRRVLTGLKSAALSAFSLLIQVDIRPVQRHPETPVNVAGFHFPSKVKLVQAAFGLHSQMWSDTDFFVLSLQNL